MKLTDEEEALRAGARGAAAQWAIEHQTKVGESLGAGDFVAVSQAHIMAHPKSLAAAGVVGKLPGDYWQVPAVVGIERVPTSDELKHVGAALGSYGSVALFHLAGITPEAQRLDDV